MIINYFKLAVRLLSRNPFFAMINIIGLSVAFTVFLILWQYSRSELKSDQFHRDYERIFRPCLILDFKDGGVWEGGISRRHNAEIIRSATSHFAEIENSTRLFNQGNFDGLPHGNQVFFFYTNEQNQQTSFEETRIAYGDPNLFDFFAIPVVIGNAQRALQDPYTMVISETTARRYFDQDEPVGKVLFLNDSIPLKVTGVFQDLPANTHLVFDMVISSATIEGNINRLDSETLPHVYYKLRPGISATAFEKDYDSFLKKTFANLFADRSPELTDEYFYLQPLPEIRFTAYVGDKHVKKSAYFFVALSVVSLVIPAMAWLNYISLTLSTHQKRMKELAARKAVGATSTDFALQFMVESFLINLISFLIALTLIQLIRQPAHLFFEFYVPTWRAISGQTWLIIACILSLGVLITGLYPAWIALLKSPIALFGIRRTKAGGFKLSRSLVTLQYVASVVLIVWATSVYLHTHYILNRHLGFDREKVVIVDLPAKQNTPVKSGIQYFTDRIQAMPFVRDATVSSSLSGDSEVGWLAIKRHESSEPFGADTNGGVDERFIPFYGIKLIAGRNFSAASTADQRAIIISRTASRRLGFKSPEEALGAPILVEHTNDAGVFFTANVIGVIADYYQWPSFHWYAHTVYGVHQGTVLTYRHHLDEALIQRKVSLRIMPAEFDERLAEIKREYHAAFPSAVFSWYFLDDHIKRHYDSEKTGSNQIVLFSVIAIGIACLGLLGIISNKVVEKTKEICIRKVLGAKTYQLGAVLLGTTIRQITISVLLGIPIARYLIQQSLDNYSEEPVIRWWYYLLPVVALLAIMLATIATELYKAARTNPAESLRYE